MLSYPRYERENKQTNKQSITDREEKMKALPYARAKTRPPLAKKNPPRPNTAL